MNRRNRPERTAKLKWNDENHLRVGHAHFLVTLESSVWESSDPDSDRFVLLKNKGMVEHLLKVAPERVDNVIDLGIFKGGSVALVHELFSPKRLVGIDWLHDRAEVLDRFISRHSLSDHVSLYYDTSQGDQDRLLWILRENFRDEPLDLVIDDCSHQYDMTKASLNVLLPRLRRGGLYVIEDWGWAHWPDEYWQGSTHPMIDQETALSKLIFELAMVVASRPGLISEMTVRPGNVYLRRGKEVVSEPEFDISACYVTAGRQLLK